MCLGGCFFVQEIQNTSILDSKVFSRLENLMKRTKVLPLRVPWKVKSMITIQYKQKEAILYFGGSNCVLLMAEQDCYARRPHFCSHTFPTTHLAVPVSGRGILKYWGPNRVDVIVFMNKNNHIGIVNIFYHKATTSRDAVLIHSGYIDHPAKYRQCVV